MEADLKMKERVLKTLRPPKTIPARHLPKGQFPQGL
jgi:hypothetical protein